jgi:hypothetical protein
MSNYKSGKNNKNKWVKMARAAKTPMEIKAVMEAIEDAMSSRTNKTMSSDMDEALGILVGLDSTSSYQHDDISLEFLREEELSDQT